MTQEEKAKRYDESLGRAQAWVENRCMASDTNRQGVLEDIFPELKKIGDDDVMKALVDYFKRYNTCGATTFNGIPADKILAWLEKQDERKPKFVAKKEVTGVLKEMLDNIDPMELEETRKEMMKSMPADKEEPKFKVGDWIIDRNDGTIMKIINNKGFYESIEIGGQRRTDTYNHVEWNFKLWSIEDAKNGDMLAGNKGDVILMFRGIGNTEWNDVIDYHCYYDCYRKDFIVQEDVEYWGDIKNNQLVPATNEQCDLLFTKIKESGYMWDTEKKELKKIVAPKFNIHDCVVKKHNSNINDFGYFIITDITDGKYWYNDRIICDITEQDEWELYEPVRQKPTAWSEEDKEMIDKIIDYMQPMPIFFESTKGKSGKEYTKEFVKDATKWLKALKQKIGE